MKIIIDAYGGDHSPDEIIKGTLAATREKEGFDVVFVGKNDGIRQVLATEEYDVKRVSVVNADEVIGCDETPTEAIRTKKNSSVVVAAKLLNEDERELSVPRSRRLSLTLKAGKRCFWTAARTSIRRRSISCSSL